ncbi:MAG: peptidyl-prolyl cis-trans isomerase [Planctomycetota bacterium]|nr:peptidyl-prolyl cis-trans isomerase [Planctomycetota bacterium]
MRNQIILSLLLLSLSSLLYGGDEEKKEVPSESERPFIVASVDHILITRLDVERFLKIFKGEYFRLEGSYLEMERERAQSYFTSALRSLISEVLLLNYAARQNWIEMRRAVSSDQMTDSELLSTPQEEYEKQLPFRLKEEDEKLVQKNIEEQSKRFGSIQDYAQALLNAGLSLDYIKDRIRISLLEERLFREKLDYDKQVSPAEIGQFYKENRSDFCQPDSLLLREIVVRFKRDSRRSLKAAEEKVKQIKEALASGLSFEETARKFSDAASKEDGGLWDKSVKLTSLEETIQAAVKELKEGEWTKEPVLLQNPASETAEFNFFKVEKRTPGESKPLEEVSEQIRNTILSKRRREASEEFFATLARSAKISVFEKGITLKSLFPSLKK